MKAKAEATRLFAPIQEMITQYIISKIGQPPMVRDPSSPTLAEQAALKVYQDQTDALKQTAEFKAAEKDIHELRRDGLAGSGLTRNISKASFDITSAGNKIDPSVVVMGGAGLGGHGGGPKTKKTK